MTPPPAADGGSRDAHGTAPHDAANAIPFDRLRGRPLALMLDVDGTLAPIAPSPSQARVPDETRRVLARLVRHPGIIVALVSGRAAQDAQRIVGVSGVWAVGNHGAEVMAPDGAVTVDALVSAFADPMARALAALRPLAESFSGVLVENKTWTLSIHYRLADPAVVPELRRLAGDVAAHDGLRLTEGSMVLEVRPPVEVDKGTAVYRLAGELGALGSGASLFFAGDDTTDEDAFRLLRRQVPNAVTLQVGWRPDTSAEFRVGTPDDVRAVLERIAIDPPPPT